MNILKRFVAGLGQQTAPFGFAPNDPQAEYKAGLGYIGDIGANLMANNQGGVDPWANLGASIQQAKQSSTERNRQQYTAQQLMEEAAAKKAEREKQASEEAQREEFLKSLPADVQMKARSIPGFLEDYIKATDPTFQTPEKPTFMEVNGKIINPMTREVIYDGGTATDSNSITAQIAERQAAAEAMGLTPDSPEYRPFVLTGKMGSPAKPYVPGAGDRGAVRAKTEENALLQQTLSNLDEAASIVKDGNINTGWFATSRSQLAENSPDWAVPDWFAGAPKEGAATLRLKQLMDAEALASMGKLLKGPTSDRDVKIMLETVNDPDASPKRKQDAIDQVKRTIRATIAANEDIIKFSLNGPEGGALAGPEDGITIEEIGP